MKKSFYQSFLVGLCLLLSVSARASDYSHLDPDHIIPKNLLFQAEDYYDQNLDKIQNKRVMGIIDFKKHNSKRRFYIIDMESGRVESYLTAHGKNSDPKHTGYATKFSNTPDSLMTSLGFYMTAETYDGKNGYSLRLDGLSATNSNARDRAIVIHGADYVTPGNLIGRSSGCPAVEQRYHADLIDRLKGGALLYAGLGSF
ncbi:MAG: murein L,D-transpeptidase catalytic domain family protein [Rhizobacter sp.]|nr:murein L,D-transpeptidase catalytic domain family protein [Bacteriovorax sp.]